jgi:hypothetical protein
MGKKGTAKVFRIVVESELGERYASAFEGMLMETRDGRTILTGEVRDQPHLFGILRRTNGLGLELLSVEALSEGIGRGPGESGRWDAARLGGGRPSGLPASLHRPAGRAAGSGGGRRGNPARRHAPECVGGYLVALR